MSMKHILIFVLCIFLVLGAVACGKQTPDQGQQPSDSTQPGQTEQPNQPQEPNENDTSTNEQYKNYEKIPSRNIYINYGKRRAAGESSSTVFYSNQTDLTLLSYDRSSDAFTGTLADALVLINDGRILRDIANYSTAGFRDTDTKYLIDVKTTENVKVGELDTLRFTGSVTSSDNRVCYVYGYAFVMDNTPCVLAGLVLTAEQEASLIESITAEVEAMIKTVRSER